MSAPELSAACGVHMDPTGQHAACPPCEPIILLCRGMLQIAALLSTGISSAVGTRPAGIDRIFEADLRFAFLLEVG